MQYPLGLGRIKKASTRLVHSGFSSAASISKKYDTYRRLGQTGRRLERLRDESRLELRRFPTDWLPPSALRVSVVCLIYKSPAWARFVHESFARHAKPAPRYGNVEFLFVANDPTDRLLGFLRSAGLNHVVFRNPDSGEYYLNRVYRAWNHGGTEAAARGDVVVFVNSDMAFSPGWLDNLLKRLDGRTIVTSRLVESGKMPSGLHAVERNFGRTHSEFDGGAFQEFAAGISEDRAERGGLYMPCAVYADTFRRSGGYPTGKSGEPDGAVMHGDVVFFSKTLRAMGLSHVTAFDSVVYHVQEGELDE